jgi:hypothetical protein
MRFDVADGDYGQAFLNGQLIEGVTRGETGQRGWLEAFVFRPSGRLGYVGQRPNAKIDRARIRGNVQFKRTPKTNGKR